MREYLLDYGFVAGQKGEILSFRYGTGSAAELVVKAQHLNPRFYDLVVGSPILYQHMMSVSLMADSLLHYGQMKGDKFVEHVAETIVSLAERSISIPMIGLEHTASLFNNQIKRE